MDHVCSTWHTRDLHGQPSGRRSGIAGAPQWQCSSSWRGTARRRNASRRQRAGSASRGQPQHHLPFSQLLLRHCSASRTQRHPPSSAPAWQALLNNGCMSTLHHTYSSKLPGMMCMQLKQSQYSGAAHAKSNGFCSPSVMTCCQQHLFKLACTFRHYPSRVIDTPIILA